MPDAIGQPLERADGHLKVTGAARYAAEWDVPGLAYGAVVVSDIACGTVRAIEAEAARCAPGVLAIITPENAPRLRPLPDKLGKVRLHGAGGMSEARQPLQDAAVHHAGQPLAVVVADTLERAHYAATLVQVSYDEQPPELAMRTARRQTRPATFLGNPEAPLQVRIGDPAAALAAAPVRLERVYESAITHHNPIEPLATIAHWERRDGADFLTLHDTSRFLTGVQQIAAGAFGLPPENVRVICPFVGGAFGAKGWLFAPPLLAALAARVAGRPVKIEWRRQDMFTVAGHRSATRQTLALGALPDGQLTALQHDTQSHASLVSGFAEPCANLSRMLYRVPNLGFTHQVAHLNLPSPSTMRGPGETVGGWALECALDELAAELKLDPVALRLKNYADQNPENGRPWSSKHLRDCYARGQELIGWAERDPRPRAMRKGRQRLGYGMATAMYPAGRNEATARATLTADGQALVESATHEIGNGAYTIFRQISADALALPVARVRFALGDTTLPPAPNTGGSVTTATVGPAVLAACRNALLALRQLAVRDAQSPLFGAAEAAIEARAGRLQLRAAPVQGEDYGAILRRAGLPALSAEGRAAPGPEQQQYSFYSFGAVFARVLVDEDTGVIQVARLCGVYDVGRVLNPRTARSQLLGGMLMGLGATLMEATRYDPRTGRAAVRSLADYHVPTHADTPDMTIEFLDRPDPHLGELGARGLGEIGCVGTPAAITNAVFHATGRRLRELPLTPDKLLREG